MKDKIVEILKETVDHTAYGPGELTGLEEAATEIAHLYSAGEEVYVECAYKEAEYSAYPHPTSRADQRVMLKKLTRPTVSEDRINEEWLRGFNEGRLAFPKLRPTVSEGEIEELWNKHHNTITNLMHYDSFKAAIHESNTRI